MAAGEIVCKINWKPDNKSDLIKKRMELLTSNNRIHFLGGGGDEAKICVQN
jgi:hypothetical protein